ncbi:hypothetical protein EON83_13455 [bacterium]|nr:MAG: hypothetical protein EON83_13455 [bacterium]
MSPEISPDSRAIILRAQNIAVEHNHNCVSPTHIFLAILESATPDSYLGALILGAGLKTEEARLYIEASFQTNSSSTEPQPRLTPSSKRALEFAADDTRHTQAPLLEPIHLFFACLNPRVEPTLEATLTPLGWDAAVLRAKQRELNARITSPTNPLEMLTGNAQKAIEAAYVAMRATWCGRISTAHLLLGLLEDERVQQLLTEVGIEIGELKIRTKAEIRTDSQLATANKSFDSSAKRALDRAREAAQARGQFFIAPEHILLALLPQRTALHEKLKWGSQLPDIAALLLTDVDAQKLRELIGPNAKSLPKNPDADVSLKTVVISFWAMMFIGIVCGAALMNSRKLNPSLQVAAIALLMTLLLINSIGACWVIITSKKPRLKSAWGAAFFGLIFGMTLMVVIFSQ